MSDIIKKEAERIMELFNYKRDKKEFPRLKTKGQLKKDALICVDEMINELNIIDRQLQYVNISDMLEFWRKVKEEINKL